MTNSTDSKTTAETTLAQLGGRQIFAMAFTGSMYDSTGAVTLKVAPALVRGTRGKSTHIVVALQADDTYAVTAVRVSRKFDVSQVDRVEGVHAGELVAVVEAMTGLRLSLGTMRSAS